MSEAGGGGRFWVEGSGILDFTPLGWGRQKPQVPGPVRGSPRPRESGLRTSWGEHWEAISCVAGESKLVRTENLLVKTSTWK